LILSVQLSAGASMERQSNGAVLVTIPLQLVAPSDRLMAAEEHSNCPHFAVLTLHKEWNVQVKVNQTWTA
jgi:hypothetical protein